MNKIWWHEKTAYQIYPKSFCDSNGDGIGDLRGIISKLDYLKELGADILWLSPIYVSPLVDQGYDIADYYNIDPRFGTMEDMDELIREAKKRDMYIVMDLVVNHCSDEHEWFRRACEDPDGKYGKYFYIETLRQLSAGEQEEARRKDPDVVFTEDGRLLPCNWRSYFGGNVWEKLPGSEDKYYLHVFHKKQPDLNWENPEVREEIYRMINWWLDRGLAGFRIDAIINIRKALPFRNYPADRADGLSDVHNMLHEATGVGEFLGELRDRTFAPHNALAIGEVFNEKEEELPFFIGENGYFSTMFDFAETVWGSSKAGWHENLDITPDAYRDCVFSTQKKVNHIGFISNIIENHDEPRGVSRYIPEGEADETSKKLLATVYFLVRGLPWIYQGQEIGMENISFESPEDIDDVASFDEYQVVRTAGIPEKEALQLVGKYGRDNARTPFQWDDSENAGFTTGKPWFRVNPNYREINLAAQRRDPESLYHYYRKLSALRKDPEYKDILVEGDFEPYLPEMHNVMAYFRRLPGPVSGSGQKMPDETHGREKDGRTILVIANFQKEARKLPLPGKVQKVLLSNLDDVDFAEGEISLKGYQAAVLEIEE